MAETYPDELWLHILDYLPVKERIGKTSLISKRFNHLAGTDLCGKLRLVCGDRNFQIIDTVVVFHLNSQVELGSVKEAIQNTGIIPSFIGFSLDSLVNLPDLQKELERFQVISFTIDSNNLHFCLNLMVDLQFKVPTILLTITIPARNEFEKETKTQEQNFFVKKIYATNMSSHVTTQQLKTTFTHYFPNAGIGIENKIVGGNLLSKDSEPNLNEWREDQIVTLPETNHVHPLFNDIADNSYPTTYPYVFYNSTINNNNMNTTNTINNNTSIEEVVVEVADRSLFNNNDNNERRRILESEESDLFVLDKEDFGMATGRDDNFRFSITSSLKGFIEADKISKQNWSIYSKIPIDFINTKFTPTTEIINVCFQPTIRNNSYLVKIIENCYICALSTSSNFEINEPNNQNKADQSDNTSNEKKEPYEQQDDGDNFSDSEKPESDDQGQLVASEETDKQDNKLSELHTHLMGMGDADFWIHFIMETLIPTLVGEVLENPDNNENIETNDVVYSVTDLCEAFELNDGRSNLEKVAHLTSIIGLPPKKYMVSNKREGGKEERYGYLNTTIIEQLKQREKEYEEQKEQKESKLERKRKTPNTTCPLKHKLTKAFEMDKTVDYSGKFTPHFYPQRFILKDAMYSMYPEILSALLLHTIFDYSNENVEYVEYSVSIKDLKRSQMRNNLEPRSLVTFWEKIKEIYPHYKDVKVTEDGESFKINDKKFYYYFLAALNRNSVKVFKGNDDELLKLDGMTIQKLHDWKMENFLQLNDYHNKDAFSKTLDQLFGEDDIEKLFEQLKITNKISVGSVVGFDWVGDEKYYAQCVFVLEEFKKLVEKYHKTTGADLGLRYHCGENIFIDDEFKYYNKHREISFEVIKQILAIDNVKLRLGHGVGYLLTNLLPNNTNDHATVVKELALWRNSVLFNEETKKPKVCFEWCPTSNEYLLFNFHHICKPFDNENGLIIATDNDGIMPVGGLEKETRKGSERIDIAFHLLVAEAKAARFVNIENLTNPKL